MVQVVAAILLGGAYSGRERKIIDAHVITVSRVDRDVLVRSLDAFHDYLYLKITQGATDMKISRFPKFAEWIRRWEPSAFMKTGRYVGSLINPSVKPSSAYLRGVRDERFGVWLARSKALQAATGGCRSASHYAE